MTNISKIFAVLAISTAITSPALAEGLGVQILRGTGIITKEQGEMVDGAHDQFKQANPSYGQWEEDLTNRTRENLGLKPHCTPVYDRYGNQRGCV